MFAAGQVTKCFWRCPMSKAARSPTAGTASICNSAAASSTAGRATGAPTIHVADDGAAHSKEHASKKQHARKPVRDRVTRRFNGQHNGARGPSAVPAAECAAHRLVL